MSQRVTQIFRWKRRGVRWLGVVFPRLSCLLFPIALPAMHVINLKYFIL